MRDPSALEVALGLKFSDRGLLNAALTHRSFANEQPGTVTRDNERLEFLGDAVLAFLVSDALFRRNPECDEGQLSRLRASLVSGTNLVTYAERLRLGEYLRLGRGEERSGGRTKPALLGDAFEALIGALYLDAGLEGARKVVMDLFAQRIDSISINAALDCKSALQERLHAGPGGNVEYRIVDESGPDHQRVFRVEAWIGGRVISEGTGTTRKAAEQVAAGRALEALDLQEGARER